MSALVYLIPAALFLGLLGLGAFLWALRSGQFDDLDGAAHRVLFDDDDGAAGPDPGAERKSSPDNGTRDRKSD
ncbi:MAG: cbb3-type cytochrome oxidase assembly protein CcoS [Alphaproteobacteria bacterium]|jgi:cbb3-type cytochrome oxidase maturation protein|nr:cbb3-type cytochrome oxidase assembly protein CcoS [Alphaproteobacteria bacterium]